LELNDEIMKKVRMQTKELVDMSLKVLELQAFMPSQVAMACIMASRKINKIKPFWTTKLEELTFMNFKEEGDLQRCFKIIMEQYKKTLPSNHENSLESDCELSSEEETIKKSDS